LRFYAFNHLAGGLLTGKYEDADPGTLPKEGRFSMFKVYPGRYWKQCYFDALEVVKSALKEVNAEATEGKSLNLVDIATGWLCYSSKLTSEDRIIIGCSNLQQLEQNIVSWRKTEKLPKKLEDACDEAWRLVMPECPSYFKWSKV